MDLFFCMETNKFYEARTGIEDSKLGKRKTANHSENRNLSR